MSSKTSLAVLLIAILLSQSLHGLKWQAMGSGMNNTVISEIWNGLEDKLDTALGPDVSALDTFVNDISDRLNARWSQAWNVVITIGKDIYDSVLYGYAFKNQWMWYNNVPYANYHSKFMVTLIVWKDYNCQDWKNIALDQTSSFTTAQKAAIQAEIGKMTKDKITNYIWGTAYTMMKNLEENVLFSSGGYSVIMCQYGATPIYGRVCRVGDGFYD